MIAQLKQYPDYKDSGMPWLGQIPKHWEVKPGRACYYEKKEQNTGLKEKTVLSLSYGRIVVKPEDKLHGLVPESFETYQIVNPGDIIIRPTDLQNDWNSLRFGLSHDRGIITSAYMCFRTKANLNGDYGHLLLHTYDLKKIFYGLGSGLRQNLDWTDFKYLPCLLPSLSEQTSIVRYLDHMERRIHRYINTKQNLIRLLEEEKQATIQSAVTHGLDRNVPLKDSGIEWLGQVPEEWRIMKIGQIKSHKKHAISMGPFGSDIKTDNFIKAGIPLIRGSNLISYKLDERKFVFISEDKADELIFANAYPLDVVITHRGTIGQVSIIPENSNYKRYVVSQSQMKVTFNSEIIFSPFANYFLNSISGQIALLLNKAQTAIPAIGQPISSLKSIQIVVPPLSEQKPIAEYIDQQNQKFDNAISKILLTITKWREYLTRLNADVVTGKLDVRDIDANLSFEPQDAESFETVIMTESDESPETIEFNTGQGIGA